MRLILLVADFSAETLWTQDALRFPWKAAGDAFLLQVFEVLRQLLGLPQQLGAYISLALLELSISFGCENVGFFQVMAMLSGKPLGKFMAVWGYCIMSSFPKIILTQCTCWGGSVLLHFVF